MNELQKILRELKKVLVAFSGGVDSTFLLKVAIDTLGKDNVLAVIATSETYPRSEMRDAEVLALELGATYQILETDEFNDPNFKKNPKDRCYFCKKELFTKLLDIAQTKDLHFVVDGSNLDDLDDFRPGSIAKNELGIRSPLQEAGIRKDEIRKFSKELGLATHNKPSFACLASRIPYGTEITKEILTKIETGEQILRDMGLDQVRVRHHGDIVRIEIEKDEMHKVLTDEIMDEISERFKELGYLYITIDLEGYRTGSMNKVLNK